MADTEPAVELDSEASDEQDIDLIEDPYPWAKDADEERRCWIFERMANSEISGSILVENMQRVNAWIKDEAVPAAEPVKKNRTGLKCVD